MTAGLHFLTKMRYKKVTVRLRPRNDAAAQLLIDAMGERGFESFVETSDGFEGYIREEDWTDGTMDGLRPEVRGVRMEWTADDVPDEDWNQEWEKTGYTPISIDGGRCVIHGPGHEKAGTEIDVIIDPRNAFGSGHHETTRMIVGTLMKVDVEGKSVMDMGCGTGVLGIVAALRGAASVTSVDIDEWSVKNTRYNATLNGVGDKVTAVKGTSDSLADESRYDILIANIFREIILSGMGSYARATKAGGTILLSGFLATDREAIEEEARRHGLEPSSCAADGEWRMCVLRKP